MVGEPSNHKLYHCASTNHATLAINHTPGAQCMCARDHLVIAENPVMDGWEVLLGYLLMRQKTCHIQRVYQVVLYRVAQAAMTSRSSTALFTPSPPQISETDFASMKFSDMAFNPSTKKESPPPGGWRCMNIHGASYRSLPHVMRE